MDGNVNNKRFQELIDEFNEMYKLPLNKSPVLPSVKRLENFRNVLSEELSEVDDIISKYKVLNVDDKSDDKIYSDSEVTSEKKIELLTEIADWLGDMIVYITSEGRKYGIDMDKALNIIMQSNFSKLDRNGKPIYDERGKVLKGPNYWRPEDKISELLKD